MTVLTQIGRASCSEALYVMYVIRNGHVTGVQTCALPISNVKFYCFPVFLQYKQFLQILNRLYYDVLKTLSEKKNLSEEHLHIKRAKLQIWLSRLRNFL